MKAQLFGTIYLAAVFAAIYAHEQVRPQRDCRGVRRFCINAEHDNGIRVTCIAGGCQGRRQFPNARLW